MADLSITAADVQVGQGATVERNRSFGEAVTAGKAVCLNSSNEYVLADCVDGDLDQVAGIAVCTGAAGQPAAVVSTGNITLGEVLTVGEIYVLSEDGGIAPVGDLTAGDYVSVLGVAISTSVLALRINNSGVQVPQA